jgi:hypothetical protein
MQVHREEKMLRMQTAVVELEQKAEKVGKKIDLDQAAGDAGESGESIETTAAILKDGVIQFKGNPMKTVKQIRCPNCRLPRLLYPRVGYNSRPVPDPTQQYCKAEPMIMLDKHDVHGQRKKGTKVKGQPKGKNKKKAADAASPAASENSDPLTPSSSMPGDSFEFKDIDYPAAKCPNRDSHLGDHWKSVNVFATHLNGSCFLKKDRAAGREANAKIGGTPKDSRASSPKAPAANGVKRKADDEVGAATKKKQKIGDGKKNAKGAPSKLKETTHVDEKSTEPPVKIEANGDILHAAPKSREEGSEPPVKLKFTGVGGGGTARKKPGKPSKKG